MFRFILFALIVSIILYLLLVFTLIKKGHRMRYIFENEKYKWGKEKEETDKKIKLLNKEE